MPLCLTDLIHFQATRLCVSKCFFKASTWKTTWMGWEIRCFLTCVYVCVFLLCLKKSNFLFKMCMFSPSQVKTPRIFPGEWGPKVSGTAWDESQGWFLSASYVHLLLG